MPIVFGAVLTVETIRPLFQRAAIRPASLARLLASYDEACLVARLGCDPRMELWLQLRA